SSFLCLHARGPLRVLPAFPTRRSSDLGSFRAKSFDALFEGVRALPWEQFIPKDGAFPVKGHSLDSALHSIPDCQRIIKTAVAARDRKSTRLNSSHVSISYAVVCLKKKN